jgi:hypothetical protein
MQTIERTQSHPCPRVALLAGAAFLAALAFTAPGDAFAACGGTGASTGVSTGTHPASAATGGTFSGSHPSAGSTGATSCGVNATTSAGTRGAVAPLLAGVHTGVITGNGGKRNGSTTFSRTANTITTVSATHTANIAGVAHTAGGAHFYRPGKHP